MASRRGPTQGRRRSGSEPAPAAVRLDRSPPVTLGPLALDPQQRAVVEHRDGHLLVLAGPGTGKTATLAELVVSRISDAVDPVPAERILALTFGRRAARELSDRISGRLGGGPVPVVSTFHSFAYGVLRQHSDPLAFASPPRLLVAAEQDVRLRELLTYAIEEGRLEWPESLSRAVGTRGIAEQVRALLARARGQGLDGKDLTRIGRRAGMPVWAALGGFFEEYLATLEFEGSLDYAELILRAAVLANDPRAGATLRQSYDLIVVDEYQDTDPAQVALLRGLAKGGAQLIAVGDPDQAIYGFRGADVRGILRFPDVFAGPDGAAAPIEVLRTTRRFPRAIAEAAAGVLGPVSLAPLPAQVQRAHRTPHAADGPARVDVRTYPSASAEAAGVAETLLRAHADEPGRAGLHWSQMAVLVRNPAVHGPVLARALRAAGIPVWQPPDETPLADEPAAGVLLMILGLALDPSGVPEATGRELLAGPLGRADAVAIRALARKVLKERRGEVGAEPAAELGAPEPGTERKPVSGPGPEVELAAPEPELGAPEPGTERKPVSGPGPEVAGPGEAPTGRPESSDVLLTAALARGEEPRNASDVPAAALSAFRRVARSIALARDAIESGQMVSEVLWAVWTASDWPERLRTAALRPGIGQSAATAAHRDLDAVVALFEIANRLPPQRRGRVGTAAFLDDIRALRLPQEVRGPQESDRDHVRLLSAHRAKGLEWELVMVASVQEGQWPDLRLRSDLLHVAELGTKGRTDGRTHADLLAEERRLMYVACTRARSQLFVSAVAERIDGGLQASRFLAELGQVVEAMPARSTSPMSAEGLIADLRRAAEAPERILADGQPDPEVEASRGAAVQRLAALAQRGESGGALGALAPADPTRWWAAQPLTGAAVRASGSAGPAAGTPADAAAGTVAGTATVTTADAAADSPADAAAAAAAGSAAGTPAGTAAGTAADSARPLRLSPSAISSLRDCPLRWFLDKRVGAGSPSGGAAIVGLVVHSVAEALARGDVSPDPAEIEPFIDEIWASVPFSAHYERVRERARVGEMIDALLRWERSGGRSVEATELAFNVAVPGTTGPVSIVGSIDRVDRDPDGRIHVVDFKTGRTAASAQATSTHPQLGVYQLAIQLGALSSSTDQADGPADQQPQHGAPDERDLGAIDERVVLGGAELVHLSDRFASGMPKVRFQAPLEDGWTWVNDLVVDAAQQAAGPDYPARLGAHCKSCAFRFMCPAQAPAPAEQPVLAVASAESSAGTPTPSPNPSPTPPAPTDPHSRPNSPSQPAAAPSRATQRDRPIQQSLFGDDL